MAICLNCSRIFEPSSEGTFCSAECAASYRHRRFKNLLLFLPLLLLLDVPGWGQAKITDSEPDTKVAQSLLSGDKVYPLDWKIEILGERAWKSAHVETKTDAAFTVRALRRTYLRESFVRSASPQELRHALLHEAGHIACDCSNEKAADNFASLKR